MPRLPLLVPAAVAALLAPATSLAAGGHSRPKAKLVDVHVLHRADSRAGDCVDAGTTTAADFAYTGWKVRRARDAFLNRSTIPAGVKGVARALQAASDAWRAADGDVPRITVETGATTTRRKANRRYNLIWRNITGDAIAVTYTWQWSDGAIESDTVFNARVPWFTAAKEGDGCNEARAAYDVRDIATHEFGHAYGMDHPRGGRFETMFEFGFTGETLKWSLGAGDIAGVRALY